MNHTTRSHEEIEQRAYQHWEQRGRPWGTPEEDWFKAEQDLDGATAAWQKVMQVAPNSVEAQTAKRALDTLQSAHPAVGGAPKPGN